MRIIMACCVCVFLPSQAFGLSILNEFHFTIFDDIEVHSGVRYQWPERIVIPQDGYATLPVESFYFTFNRFQWTEHAAVPLVAYDGTDTILHFSGIEPDRGLRLELFGRLGFAILGTPFNEFTPWQYVLEDEHGRIIDEFGSHTNGAPKPMPEPGTWLLLLSGLLLMYSVRRMNHAHM